MHSTHVHHIASAPHLGSLHAVTLEESNEIRRTYGSTPIYILRQSYGAGFAPGTPGDVTLGQALDHLDAPSRALLVRRLADHGGDELNRI
jgi:hypothetical protein